MNTTEMTPEQRLEAFKMCMAEAGFPQPAAYVGRIDHQGQPVITMPGLNDVMDPAFWRAVWRSNLLIGDPIVKDWCLAHFAAARTGNRWIGDKCPCHSGTSGYEQAGL